MATHYQARLRALGIGEDIIADLADTSPEFIIEFVRRCEDTSERRQDRSINDIRGIFHYPEITDPAELNAIAEILGTRDGEGNPRYGELPIEIEENEQRSSQRIWASTPAQNNHFVGALLHSVHSITPEEYDRMHNNDSNNHNWRVGNPPSESARKYAELLRLDEKAQKWNHLKETNATFSPKLQKLFGSIHPIEIAHIVEINRSDLHNRLHFETLSNRHGEITWQEWTYSALRIGDIMYVQYIKGEWHIVNIKELESLLTTAPYGAISSLSTGKHKIRAIDIIHTDLQVAAIPTSKNVEYGDVVQLIYNKHHQMFFAKFIRSVHKNCEICQWRDNEVCYPRYGSHCGYCGPIHREEFQLKFEYGHVCEHCSNIFFYPIHYAGWKFCDACSDLLDRMEEFKTKMWLADIKNISCKSCMYEQQCLNLKKICDSSFKYHVLRKPKIATFILFEDDEKQGDFLPILL